MTGPASSQSQWQSIVGMMGVAGAALWVAWTLPSPAHPLGSDWGHHFTVAEFLWHPNPDIGYPLFRRPWFGWLLGAMGEGMGYLPAAQLIGRVSACLIVVAAGLGAWALAGPLAAGVAALIAAWMPLVREGGLWVNHYPALGAVCGLALAAGAAASRWPRVPWVIAAGLTAGAAAAIDVRGEAVLPAVFVLVAVGLPWRKDWARTGVLTGTLVLASAAIPLHAAWLDQAFSVPEIEFAEQVKVQRKGVLGQVQGGTFNDPSLEQACAGVVVGPMDAASLQTPCAHALRGNALRRLSETGMLPAAGTLCLLALVLLPQGPGRRERLRSAAAGALVFGLPVSALWAGMGWVTYFPRYVLPFAAVVAMLVPVAFFRALGVWGRAGRVVGPVAALAAAVWALQVWPGTPSPLAAAQTEGAGADRAAGHFAVWVSEELGDDDFMVDCAGLAVDSLLLPRQIEYVRFPPGDPACLEHIRSPMRRAGTIYLITMHRDLPEHMVQDVHSRSAIAGHGWAPVRTDAPQGYQLWRHGEAQ